MGEHLQAAFAQRPRHDPGETSPAGDPLVSQIVYALRDLGVTGQAVALDVLGDVGGAGLSPAQTAAVLQQFTAPAEPDDPLAPEHDPQWDSQWDWDTEQQEWTTRT